MTKHCLLTKQTSSYTKSIIFLLLFSIPALVFSQPLFNGIRENIGTGVNDSYKQIRPVFSTDGGTLFFSQGSGINQQLEIWKTTSDTVGRLTGKEKIKALNPNNGQPKYLLQSLSTHQYLVSGAYEVYKNRFQYTRGISLFDTTNAQDVFVPATYQRKSSPTLDSIFKRTNIYPFYHPFFNMYAWSQTDGTQSDIYLLLDERDTSTKPHIIKLPPTVNTAGNEITPWLDDEGRFLYFASDKPGGFGETDIYVSERLDASFQKWSPAKNLGPAVNSNKADFDFLIDPFGIYGYFVSEKNTFGSSDIFRIRLQQTDSTIYGTSPLLLPTDKPDTSIQFTAARHASNNIVFLLDISRSMAQSRKMVLLKKSMYRLTQQLRSTDKVSIVIFGGAIETLLAGQYAKNKAAILDAIQSLSANGGSTNISAGLQRAYEAVTKFYIPNANNQLFVVTDGVFKLKPADEQLILRHPNVLLTAVVVGNDPEVSEALQPMVQKANGQMLNIKNETHDLNLILQNVRANAVRKK